MFESYGTAVFNSGVYLMLTEILLGLYMQEAMQNTGVKPSLKQLENVL